MNKDINIFDFGSKENYIINHKVLYCKNKNDVNKFLFRKDIGSLCENHSYEINVDSLIGRKYIVGNNEIDDGGEMDIYKKIYLINIQELVDGDSLYDIELIGNIYRVYIIIDNLITMKITNNFKNNKKINIPEFKVLKPYPLISTEFSKFHIGIEMNNDYVEGINEKIHLNFKTGYYNSYNRVFILKNTKYNIYFTECQDIATNNLLILNGKCIPIIFNTLEYFV
jgi:hypothetical protein